MRTRKQLIRTTLSLLLMIVALGTGVFAWFTINTKTTATDLDGSAEAADGGFYLRFKDDENWTNELDLKGLKPKGPSVLKPLQTLDGKEFKTRFGQESNDGFFEFEIEFITGSSFTNIYLEELNMLTPQATSWVAEYDINSQGKEIKAGYRLEAKLVDAIRVSFEDGNGEIDTSIIENDGIDITNYADAIELGTDTEKTVFNNTKGFGGFALDYLNKVEDRTLIVPSSYRTDDVILEAITEDYFGIKLTESKTVLTGDQYFLAKGSNVQELLDSSHSMMSSIIIRVWLEGWDGEAFNAVASGQVLMDFKFRANLDI